MLRLAVVYAAAAYLSTPLALCSVLAVLVHAPGSRWPRPCVGWIPAALLAAALGVLERHAPAPALPQAGLDVEATVWIA